MNRILALGSLVLGALLACAQPTAKPVGKIHASPMGYRVTIPSDWTLVDRETLAQMNGPDGAATTDGIDPAALESVRTSIATGNIEFFFLASGSRAFRDNVNVLRAPGTLPPSAAAVPMTCALSARQLSDALGTSIAFRRCDFVRIGKQRAFTLDWSNSVQKSRSIQYQLPLTSSTILIVTGAFTEETAAVNGERLRDFVEAMVLDSSRL